MERADQRLCIVAVQELSPFSTCEDESEMAYYFAYGSNLNFHDWQDFCKEHRYWAQAKLTNGIATQLLGWRLVFNYFSCRRDGLVANIVVSEGDHVPGVVFELDDYTLQVLDHKEGVPNAYQRLDVTVKRLDEVVAAITYVVPHDRCQREGQMCPAYLEVIRGGYRDFGLDSVSLESAAHVCCSSVLRD